MTVIHSGLMEKSSKQLYTVTEVAKMKGTSRQNIHAKMRTRDVKFERLGKLIVIPKTELFKFD